MTPYDAVMKAADFIEQNPERYAFFPWWIPKDTSCKGCMLGWTGFFLEMTDLNDNVSRVAKILGVTDQEFYDFGKDVGGRGIHGDPFEIAMARCSYQSSAEVAVKVLRAFAKERLTNPQDPAYIRFKEKLEEETVE